MQHVGTEEEEEEEEEECRCSWRKSFPLGASPMHIEQDDHFLGALSKSLGQNSMEPRDDLVPS